jgi:hypothetical protein
MFKPITFLCFAVAFLFICVGCIGSVPGQSIPAFPGAEDFGAMAPDGRSSMSGQSVPAFPGAEGFGAMTPGGRGGRVIEITNLHDKGPGSLRACLAASGPRTCVFRSGGTIDLQSGIHVLNPYLTIAGQTAPDGGIALRNARGNTDTPITISTHDVIVRYLRFRPGPKGLTKNEADQLHFTLQNARNQRGITRELSQMGGLCCLAALDIHTGSNIVIDHVSASWGIDANMDIVGNSHDITVQWSIISEGLLNSVHSKGSHSTAGDVTGGAGRVSLHHNLIAHNSDRNFKLKGEPAVPLREDEVPEAGPDRIFDFVNNVIYNWGSLPTACAGFGRCNIVANFYKPGVNTHYPDKREIVRMQGITPLAGTPGRSLYVVNNVGPSCPNGCADDWAGGMISDVDGTLGNNNRSDTRHPAPLVTTMSATEAFNQVLANAGATLPTRDAVDTRVVNDVYNGTGRIIDHPDEVGGWPMLLSGVAPVDTDHDGMPDQWEMQHGFDQSDPADAQQDANGDGYTNLEEYLNSLTPFSNSPSTAGTKLILCPKTELSLKIECCI